VSDLPSSGTELLSIDPAAPDPEPRDTAATSRLEGPARRRDPVVALSLSMFLIGAGEVIASPMMAEMGASFGVSSARVAWLPGTYALTYAALAPLLGPLSDRLGRKALLVPGLFGLGSAVVATALAPSFALACVTSALGGLCAGAVQPNALAIINDAVPEAQQPAVTGKVFLGLTSSFVLVPVLSGWLAAHFSWRVPYFAMGAACFTAAGLVLRVHVPHARRGEPARMASAFRSAFAIPFMRRRFVVSFLWLGLCIGLAALLGEILRRRLGLSTQAIGTWTGVFGVSVLAGNLLMERVRLWLGSHRRVLLWGSLGSVAGCVVVAVLPIASLYALLPAGLAWGLGYGMAGPAHHYMVARAGGDYRGTVVAINASILNSGLMAVTLTAGRVLDAMGVEPFVGLLLALQLVGVALVPSLPASNTEAG
jgi:predicted MFS family arabinose efflux permease